MANTPTKMTDPTEAALSAIRDALSIRDNPSEPEAAMAPPLPPVADPSEEPAPEPPWHAVRADVSDGNGFDAALGGVQEPIALRPAVNGERESISQILQTLHRRPARTSYLIATVFAALWVFAGVALGQAPRLRRRRRLDDAPDGRLPELFI